MRWPPHQWGKLCGGRPLFHYVKNKSTRASFLEKKKNIIQGQSYQEADIGMVQIIALQIETVQCKTLPEASPLSGH